MLTRLTAFFIALGFLAGFITSLSLDLHGAIAVICAVGFFAFLSATVNRSWKIPLLTKQIVGGILVALSIFSFRVNPHQNIVFVATVTVCGILLLLDPLVLWLTTREPK